MSTTCLERLPRTPLSPPTARTSDDTVLAAMAGVESAFAELVDRHRGELVAHCSRILRSSNESEDLAQEAFLRAWHKRESFRGPSFRAWLYRIATNVCLSALQRRRTRQQVAPVLERGWAPDPGPLESVAANEPEPATQVIAKETLELALLAAIRHLPPRQRATLFLSDVLGWPARDTAELLATSVASVTSALQRARASLREVLPERLAWASDADPSDEERAVLARILDAVERADAGMLAALGQTDGRTHAATDRGS